MTVHAVKENNDLVLKDNVFELFNLTPSKPSHVSISNAIGIARKGILNLALTSSLFPDRTKYSTVFVPASNSKEEARVLLSYIKTNLPSTPFNLVYEKYKLGLDWMQAWQTSGTTFVVAAPFTSGVMPSDVGFRTDVSGVIHFGSAGRIGMGAYRPEISVSSENFSISR